jgi:hypothetical protein
MQSIKVQLTSKAQCFKKTYQAFLKVRFTGGTPGIQLYSVFNAIFLLNIEVKALLLGDKNLTSFYICCAKYETFLEVRFTRETPGI